MQTYQVRINQWMIPCLFLGALLLLSACSASSEGEQQAQDNKEDSAAQQRIVTLHPVLTKTVFALGLGEQVVATDRSSQAPAAASKLPKLGYHRMLSTEGLLKHEPTLVLATEATGPKEVLQQVREAKVTVEKMTAPKTFGETYKLVKQLGEKLDRQEQSDSLVRALKTKVDSAKQFASDQDSQPKVLPFFARGGPGKLFYIGKGNTAANMVQAAGGQLAIDREGSSKMTAEGVIGAKPDVLLVSKGTMKMLGGVKGIQQHPFLGKTPAAQNQRILTIPDGQLMGLGPDSGATLLRLARELHQQNASAS